MAMTLLLVRVSSLWLKLMRMHQKVLMLPSYFYFIYYFFIIISF